MTIALFIIAASVAFAVVLTCGIMLALRSSAAYRAGVERARRSPDVIALIGEPIKASFFMRGGIRGGGKLASLDARLSGSRGRGTLEIRATKEEDAPLRFTTLKFRSGGKVVDLLGAHNHSQIA